MGSQEITLKIQQFYEAHNRMPSVREVRDHILHTHSMKLTKALIDGLVAEGIVRKDTQGKLQPTTAIMGIRKLGSVEAGYPSPAEEELADIMTLDEWLIRDKKVTFMLEVKGDSMVNAGLRDGDVVIVERFRKPKNNDIVVACIDNQWTIKYFRKRGQSVALIPANEKYKAIIPSEELRIEAVVTALIRKY